MVQPRIIKITIFPLPENDPQHARSPFVSDLLKRKMMNPSRSAVLGADGGVRWDRAESLNHPRGEAKGTSYCYCVRKQDSEKGSRPVGLWKKMKPRARWMVLWRGDEEDDDGKEEEGRAG